MRKTTTLVPAVLLVASLISACGGSGGSFSDSLPTKLMATTTVSNPVVSFSANRSNYAIAKTSSGYSVTDRVGSAGVVNVLSGSTLKFTDLSVSLAMGDLADTISSTDLQSLIELYIAFFNRLPDAEGMTYWIGQRKSGSTIAQIAESFYNAGVQYTAQTGYSAQMSNTAFVSIIYQNVLGRTGSTAPTDAELNYWAVELQSGRATKGSLISTMLDAARSYASDAKWGWVTTQLNNKLRYGRSFAIEQGLTYNSAADNISKTTGVTSTTSFGDGFYLLLTIPDATLGASWSTSSTGCALSTNVVNNSPKVMANSISSWSCSSTLRSLTGNGIPDHAVVSGNFATPISSQSLLINFSIAPTISAVAGTILSKTASGYVFNGIKLDPGTDGTCAATATSVNPGAGCVAAGGRDPWNIEALGGAFKFGTDENNAHVQPNGQYHYHGMPEGYLTLANKGQTMTLVGFAMDGFPIYARYGLSSANNPNSSVRILKSSYIIKAVPDTGRPSTTIFPMGTFTQDYQYLAGSGDLDECNGRTGITPEFPGGIYHYTITDSFPYIQRCIKGTSLSSAGPPR